MIPGLTGSLLSHEAVAKGMPSFGRVSDGDDRERVRRQLRSWHVPLLVAPYGATTYRGS